MPGTNFTVPKGILPLPESYGGSFYTDLQNEHMMNCVPMTPRCEDYKPIEVQKCDDRCDSGCSVQYIVIENRVSNDQVSNTGFDIYDGISVGSGFLILIMFIVWVLEKLNKSG